MAAETITEALRRDVRESGLSLYAIAAATGISHARGRLWSKFRTVKGLYSAAEQLEGASVPANRSAIQACTER